MCEFKVVAIHKIRVLGSSPIFATPIDSTKEIWQY